MTHSARTRTDWTAAQRFTRRKMLATTAGMGGLSLPGVLQLRSVAAPVAGPKAKSCIIVSCWGGMSHLETWDPKPDAPLEVRGEFAPIATAPPGVFIGEHMPLLAGHTEKLAIVRSIHHNDAIHVRGMYWNLTGHQPPRAGNIPPRPADWRPADVHATIFHALGISPRAELHDMLGRPFPASDGEVLPLL